MVFRLFKKSCLVYGMDISKGGIEKKGKTFCSRECLDEYRRRSKKGKSCCH